MALDIEDLHRIAVECFTVDDEAQAEETLRRLKWWRSEQQRITAHAEQQMEEIRRWQDGELEEVTQKIAFHENCLASYLLRLGRKSLSLITGTFKFRKQPDKIEVLDKAAFELWAQGKDTDAWWNVTVTKSPKKAAIKELIKSTGEIPDGVEYVEQPDKLAVEL